MNSRPGFADAANPASITARQPYGCLGPLGHLYNLPARPCDLLAHRRHARPVHLPSIRRDPRPLRVFHLRHLAVNVAGHFLEHAPAIAAFVLGSDRRGLHRRFESVERRQLSGHLFPRARKGRPRSLLRACTGHCESELGWGCQQLRRCPLPGPKRPYSVPQPARYF